MIFKTLTIYGSLFAIIKNIKIAAAMLIEGYFWFVLFIILERIAAIIPIQQFE